MVKQVAQANGAAFEQALLKGSRLRRALDRIRQGGTHQGLGSRMDGPKKLALCGCHSA
jgi:hypothetical protein